MSKPMPPNTPLPAPPADPTKYVHASSLQRVIDDPGPWADAGDDAEWANTIAGTVIHDLLCWRERSTYLDLEEAWDAEVERLARNGKTVAYAQGQSRELTLRRIAKHIDATPRPGSLCFGHPLILTECSFRFYDPVAAVWFAGTVDVIIVWPTGRVLIIDYKTGDHFPDLLLNPQLVLYPLAGYEAAWTCKARYVDHWHGLDWTGCDDWFRLPVTSRPEMQVWYTPDFVGMRERGADWPIERTGIYSIPQPPIESARNYLRALTDVWRRRKAHTSFDPDPEDFFAEDLFADDPFGDDDD